jgi:cytidyltransferase-like protein
MIINFGELNKLVSSETVYTSGVFDMLHKGHVTHFREIKKKFPNCLLVVGVAPDKRVQYKKGKNRPILKQKERAEMVNAVKYVDYVFVYPLILDGKVNPFFTVIKDISFFFFSKKSFKYFSLLFIFIRSNPIIYYICFTSVKNVIFILISE